MDNGDRQGGGAGFDPVFAELVPVARMDWLYGVADVVEKAIESVIIPAGAAKGLPDSSVMGEGTEGDEGIVRGAAAENFGARVADVRVAYMSMYQSQVSLGCSVRSVLFISFHPYLAGCTMFLSWPRRDPIMLRHSANVTDLPFGCSVVP